MTTQIPPAPPAPPADGGASGGAPGEPGGGPTNPLLVIPHALARGAKQAVDGIEHLFSQRAPTRALSAVPRTAHFMGSTAMRGRGDPADLPVPSLSPGFAAHVAMDELILALAMGPNRFPVQADFDRVAAELAHARLLFDARGWLDEPESYHRDPPPLTDPSFDRGKFLGTSYERLLFPSGWEPRDDEPGAARWNGYTANRTASATILRHEGPPRPWVVAIHGFGMGFPFMDLTGLHAGHLHNDLGLNVVMPVLPLHGARRITRVSGEAFLSFDLINTVHGLAQSVWDIRRILGWVHDQDAPQVALYGVSLGAYISSLLTGLVDDVDTVIAGVPVVDFPAMFHHQAPHRVRLRAVEHEILDGNAELVHRVVSPLAFAPRVAKDRRFIFAGLGDRMAPPDQALALWRHWDEPEISWYAGNHVGYLWSRQVTAFLNDSLTASGLVPEGAGDQHAGDAGDGETHASGDEEGVP